MTWDGGNQVTASNIADVCPELAPVVTETAATETPEATETTETPAEDTMTIYFENNWKWSDVCIYFWGSTTSEALLWPGEDMNYVDTTPEGNDRYVFEVPTDIIGIVFNGGE